MTIREKQTPCEKMMMPYITVWGYGIMAAEYYAYLPLRIMEEAGK